MAMCNICKHREVLYDQDPCNQCGGPSDKFEPRNQEVNPMSKSCSTCEFDYLPPSSLKCRMCLTNGKSVCDFPGWTPEQPKATWIPWENHDDTWECSDCKEPFSFPDGLTPQESNFKFCPNCGLPKEV